MSIDGQREYSMGSRGNGGHAAVTLMQKAETIFCAEEQHVSSEQLLHIVRSGDGRFRLMNANLPHSGSLEELEGILYAWALDEGWPV